jgi:ribonucleoside-diphosphate reductase alpha chain
LRPKGALVNNSSNTTPGVMTFAEKFSHTTLNTQQENRRGALMLVLNVDHPDLIDFVTKKLDLNAVNGANISLAVTDAFMSAVEKDEDWVMKFETPHESIEKKVRARQLMHLISYANHTVGDPGFLLMDNINNYHLLSEYPEVHFNATNPCGEQPLMENGSCNLGSINLNAFVRRPFTDDALFDLERFREVTKQMTWGLDELLTLLGDRHALPAQREHVINWREIGLGVMGLADMALSMNMAYGSPEFIAVLDNVMKEMANAAAQASALRAKDLGIFPKFNLEYAEKSKFYQDVYTEETKELIREHGLRNSRILSIAPTGSISNVLGVSGGVEPFFMLGYQREIKSFGEEPMKIWVVEKTPKKLMDHLGLKTPEELPEWAKITSQNIPFEDRAKVQATIQKYVDTAISSTFNVNADAEVSEIEEIYMVSWKYGLKGATVFRDKCKKAGILSDGGQILNHNPAPFPWITVDEKWTNKKTGEVREFSNHIQITDEKYKAEQIDVERCPLCGAALVKQGGCTKCANPECVYEKCAI